METVTVKEAGNLLKFGASSQRSSSSGSSVQDLHELSELCSANKRVSREDRNQRNQGKPGLSCVPPLAKQLSVRLDKLDLISKDLSRVSVITVTPSRLPATSTPSNSPPAPPPPPPRNCQSLGPICPPVPRSHSPSCSDISSINGDVFSDSESLAVSAAKVPLPKSRAAPGTPLCSSNPVLFITGAMQEEEEDVLLKQKMLYYKMRKFTSAHINEGTISSFDAKMDQFDQEASDLIESMEKLLIKHETNLGGERTAQWKAQQVTAERDSSDYTQRMFQQANEVRKSLSQAQNSSNGQNSQLNASSFQAEQLHIMRKQNQILEKNQQAKEAENAERLSESARESEEKRAVAVAKAKNKCDAIQKDGEALLEKVNKVDIECWKDQSELSIGRAMRGIKGWEEDLQKIIILRRDLDDVVASNGLTQEDAQILEAGILVDRVSEELRFATESIEDEDNARELYTLDISKADPVKLPTFEGRDDEDFAQFKKLLEKAFVQNRVTKSDKVDKLREVLRGHAKKLVPQSTVNDIDEAMEILNKAFGDPVRLMTYRKDSLLKLGFLPRENAKGGVKTQVEWYLEVESLLKNIIDLGKKSSELDREAFSGSSMNNIMRMFPSNLQRKLDECPGDGSDRVEAMLKKIAGFRSTAQRRKNIIESTPAHGGASGWSAGHMQHLCGDPAGGDVYADDGYDCDGYGADDGYYGDGYYDVGGCHEIQGLIAYRPPRRDEACRVCKTLEGKGDTYQIYENHVHSFPTGCPRYIAMSVEERLQLATAAKLCLLCHDPEYILKQYDKDHRLKCLKVRGKGRFSCQEPNCSQHMWVCTKHKGINNQGLSNFKDEINTKFGLNFGFVVSIPALTTGVPHFNVHRKKKGARKGETQLKVKPRMSPKKLGATKHKAGSALKIQNQKESENVAQVKEVAAEENATQMEEVFDAKSPCAAPKAAAATLHHKNLSSQEALNKLRKKLSLGGVNDELRPVPKGRAQFIIGYTKGRTRSLLTLYDTGCGSVLFREGVPQYELGLSVLKTKGPFIVKGVGDTTVTVNNEYMCSVKLDDGSRQGLEGWTVDKITATLPTVNLSVAEAEIKASLKDNEELQNLRCQPTVGGDCDILLGILYSSIFPIAVHSLPNGLTIYRMQISSHDNQYNCAIGGPHESFEYMANHFGSMTIVFANLCQQLESYKKFGPPKISKAIMTVEDMRFAEKYKDWEIENFYKDALAKELNQDGDESQEIFLGVAENITEKSIEQIVFDNVPDLGDDYYEESTADCRQVKRSKKAILMKTADEAKLEEVESISVTCAGCGSELSEEGMEVLKALPARSVDEDDSVKQWKKIQQAQQEGLNIEYRCPKCRSCSDCRRSFETERVSLREEAEDSMIWDSVEIDWKEKKIICYLPLRGEEEEFLANNRDIALKILDQQCYKYFKDEETRKLIVKAFEKLLKNDQMVLWKDLSEEDKKLIESKTVSHYIPWRVVFKPSISTPARTVFDGSQNTKPREDGSGGRCLNDAVVKGRVVTLNLVKMVMRFEVGKDAIQGDLKQFYASIKLVHDQWNLQRVLFRPDLDPSSEVQEAVIKTLIWGIKCVSAQSECAIIKLAEAIKDTNPRLADLLLNSRFVDDLGDSAKDIETLKKLIDEADKLFSSVGLACKGWSISGSSPPPDVTEEGETVSIGGMKWHTKLDLLEVPLPQLHFSKKLRGRLVVGTEVFSGSLVEDMDKFVPRNLTRRMIFSKNGAVFDLLGKFTPVMIGLSKDLREAVKKTIGWDDPVPEEVRSKWVNNFWRLETLRGIKFQRARMPEDAASTEMNLIVAVDAAAEVKIVGAWGRFRLKNGEFSCQLVIGRSLLVGEDSTIPKNELDALTMGSNLGWIVRQALEEWVSSYILIGDSTIALCWVSSEKKRLSLFHRNRCVQVRRGTELELIFHVISECNPADLGTRPEAVKDSDVGPNSKWEVGLPWMKKEIDDAVETGILTPISKLRLNEEEEDSFNKGLVFEKTPEILTRGHISILQSTRVENVKARAEFSDYALSPTKFPLEKTVRIYSVMWRFIKSFKCLRGRFEKGKLKLNTRFQMFLTFNCVKGKVGRSNYELEVETSTEFQMCSVTPIFTIFDDKDTKHVFNVFDDEYIDHIGVGTVIGGNEKVVDTHRIKALGFGVKKPGIQFKGKNHVLITDDDISRSLEYLYKKGTEEVIKFNKPELVRKISIEKDGVLYSKSRILNNQRFQIAGGLENKNILGQGEFGINVKTPVLDRFSPLSYSVGDYIHRKISKHGGYETCLRDSLNVCFIIQGMSLFRELGDDCTKCAKLRRKYLDISEGPIADEQLIVAPPFWVAMVDIFGPCYIYVPGHSMKTRNRKVVDVKCYVLVFVCPTTKMTNLQVIESKSADGVVEGINRLGCETGFPSFVLADQDSGILKVMKEAEVNLKNLEMILYKERGIKFRTCPVSGHNYHGGVERRIKSVQDCLEKIDVANMRLHATGLQTLLKLIENDLNNLPLGYSYSRDSDNSPLLKLIFPNMLKIGRLNTRAMDGPIRMPASPGELMEKIDKGYSAFFKIWNTTMIPKLMRMHKWFDNKSQLVVGDIVHFRKVENELSSKWTVGKVTDVIKSKDGLVRRAIVQYQNSTESEPRFTDRAARSLIKLFNIDDTNWQDDMNEVERLIDAIRKKDEDLESASVCDDARSRHDATGGYDKPQREEGVQHRPSAKVARAKTLKSCIVCCCLSHCLITDHSPNAVPVVVDGFNYHQEHLFAGLLDASWLDLEEYQDLEVEMYDMATEDDSFTSLLCAVHTNFGGGALEDAD